MVWKPPPLGFPVSAIANAHTPVLHTSALLLGTASTDFLFRFAIAIMQERGVKDLCGVFFTLLYLSPPPPLKGYEEVSIESAGDRGPRGARERR